MSEISQFIVIISLTHSVTFRINTVIFDKTGTLTVGKPIVTDEVVVNKTTKGMFYL